MDVVILVLITFVKLLYNSPCLSVRSAMGNVIYSTPIKDRKLKLLVNIPINLGHNPYNKVTGCFSVCLSVCTEGSR